MKIYYKLPLLLAIYSVFLTSLLFIHSWHSENGELEKYALKEVRLQMSRLQAELTNAFQNDDNLEIQRELSWLSAIPEIVSILITDDNDWILQATRFGWGGKFAPDIFPEYDRTFAQKVRKTNQSAVYFSQDRRTILLYYPLNLIEEGKLRSQQSHCIFMLYSLEHRKNELLWHYWQEIKLAFLIALLASLGLMGLLHQLIYSRVEKLVQVSQKLSTENYNIRVHIEGGDELAKLGTTFNEMAKRLDQAHYDLYQQNHLYNALSEINQAIVRTQNEQELFTRLCEIAVSSIGLESAWVLLINQTNQNNSLKIISAGALCDCALNLHITPEDLNNYDNLIAQVWLEKKARILNEFDPLVMPFDCHKGSSCSVKSIAIFPLFQENEMIGIVHCCASEPQFFISERLKLFEEIINDICYALDSLASEQRRLNIEEMLRKERAFFKKIIDTIPVMIVDYEREQQLISVNKEFERLMGFTPNKNWQNFQELRQLFENTDKETIWRDYKLLSYYGEMIDTSWACIGLEENSQIGIGIDLTEHKKSERSIRHLAYFDPLTNLPNRRHWNEFANKHLSTAHKNHDQTIALLCLDLDRFKTINDTRGHDIGDKLLVQVADRLRKIVTGNNMLARLGGDEFSFLLFETEKPEAAIVAQRILDILSTPFIFEHHELKIGGSIGISCYPNDGKSLDLLYKYADIAMYHAKQKRIGYAFFEEDQAKKLEENVALEQALQQAVKNNQLYLYYQPRVDLIDEKVTSVEALLRWNHEEYGEISPEYFIALAEQSGLIHDIDEWVLRTACQQAKIWREKGLQLRVAINLSVKILQRDTLFEKVKEILLETKAMGAWLEIEITETAALYDFESACRLLLKLKSLGMHVSIDDFGTGYSSLTYLKHLPIDSLKIDRSLLQEVEQPTSINNKIVRSLLCLARNLDLSVIAEGVETVEQQIFLKNSGCQSVQGFYYSKAVDPEKLEELGQTFNWFKYINLETHQ
ncbi:MAG: hypothetical protein RIT27_1029 [Pseudomonadota bacterium]|jgi:diguanylate cyclase (GGDEF)-like protein